MVTAIVEASLGRYAMSANGCASTPEGDMVPHCANRYCAQASTVDATDPIPTARPTAPLWLTAGAQPTARRVPLAWDSPFRDGPRHSTSWRGELIGRSGRHAHRCLPTHRRASGTLKSVGWWYMVSSRSTWRWRCHHHGPASSVNQSADHLARPPGHQHPPMTTRRARSRGVPLVGGQAVTRPDRQ